MKNTYKIYWTDEALDNLTKIIKYLEDRWTDKEIRNFSKLLEKQIELIQANPELFPFSLTSDGLRRSVLTKQTTIYYQISNDEIRTVTLFANRQDPKKVKR